MFSTIANLFMSAPIQATGRRSGLGRYWRVTNATARQEHRHRARAKPKTVEGYVRRAAFVNHGRYKGHDSGGQRDNRSARWSLADERALIRANEKRKRRAERNRRVAGSDL